MKSPKNTPSFSPESYVHEVFSLQRPMCMAYKRGWGPLDSEIRMCRDEQAWMVVLEYNNNDRKRENCQLAAVYMRSSVSKNEMKKAMDLVAKAFPSIKGKRPAIHEFDRMLLRAIWNGAERMAKKELRPKPLVEWAQKCMKIVKRPISESKIWAECRTWRSETGRKVKKGYVTKKRDTRPA
jgi:hypothetical protein